MKVLLPLVALTVSTFAFAPQASAQSDEQLGRLQSACLISVDGCVAAVESLSFGLSRLPNAQRRAAVANIASNLRNQALPAAIAVRANIAAGLQTLARSIDDPDQLAAVTSLSQDLLDGIINDGEAFDANVALLIARALAPDSAG